MTTKIAPARALILTSLAAEIEEVAHDRDHLMQLAGRYAAEQRLKLTYQAGRHFARMRNISASSTENHASALAGWARAARRELLEAGAL